MNSKELERIINEKIKNMQPLNSSDFPTPSIKDIEQREHERRIKQANKLPL